MNTPEVRLSPDGQSVAIHWPWAQYWESRYGSGCYPEALTDAEVSEWTPLLPVSNEDEAFDIYLPGGRYYGRWITVSDHDATLGCSCGYKSGVEELPPVLDRAADELHRGH